ncbi:helix-turn-helix transcriptional regulator [Halalkalibacterium halodurans]|uniref:BH0346 protein n=1 Tax=Halalkalibacterium halodurans (strain ATCC BAA-125 / DSM 18197 / FERM 7344 / JCM 9153 / C-125) TaxID=272558 RepID=Q9KFX4_HALH5|nr:helix-turn-helix transcriptional regulator [Halalkalibacterium halodurans]MED4122644.1 helix-turn-helix transcriptional regulator [Halalkalibacterium halodurans]MED4172865.1 helix-turn-helix transcriptional regulator [Halalkalibacterium halodurans]BAB04065.1 BH0346 [Halalkalibacterium halodurans C-125]
MRRREKLISFRKGKNWSQQDVVDLLKVRYDVSITESYYGMIEQGVRMPSLTVAIAVSHLFQVEPSVLFGVPRRKAHDPNFSKIRNGFDKRDE